MTHSIQRSEPRFELGTQVVIARNLGDRWQELSGFTVNVSEHGLLVTMSETPQSGERVRVKLPPPGDFWGEAVVCHVIPGTVNCLVGMRLDTKHGTWLIPRRSG